MKKKKISYSPEFIHHYGVCNIVCIRTYNVTHKNESRRRRTKNKTEKNFPYEENLENTIHIFSVSFFHFFLIFFLYKNVLGDIKFKLFSHSSA